MTVIKINRVLICGRHFSLESPDATAIEDWELHHTQLCDCAVAVDPSVDRSDAVHKLKIAKTLPVQPWVGYQKWTAPLHALLAEAALQGKEYILYCSTGVRVAQEALEAMVRIMDQNPDVVFVGPYTDNHYFFEEGMHQLSGISIPWNNTGLWRVSELVKIGFVPVSDGLVDPRIHGVEEVATLALLWMLNRNTRAVLVDNLPGDYTWVHEPVYGKAYLDWADEKLRSKEERPAGQLEILGLQAPEMVIHLDWNRYLETGRLLS